MKLPPPKTYSEKVLFALAQAVTDASTDENAKTIVYRASAAADACIALAAIMLNAKPECSQPLDPAKAVQLVLHHQTGRRRRARYPSLQPHAGWDFGLMSFPAEMSVSRGNRAGESLPVPDHTASVRNNPVSRRFRCKSAAGTSPQDSLNLQRHRRRLNLHRSTTP